MVEILNFLIVLIRKHYANFYFCQDINKFDIDYHIYVPASGSYNTDMKSKDLATKLRVSTTVIHHWVRLRKIGFKVEVSLNKRIPAYVFDDSDLLKYLLKYNTMDGIEDCLVNPVNVDRLTVLKEHLEKLR